MVGGDLCKAYTLIQHIYLLFPTTNSLPPSETERLRRGIRQILHSRDNLGREPIPSTRRGPQRLEAGQHPSRCERPLQTSGLRALRHRFQAKELQPRQLEAEHLLRVDGEHRCREAVPVHQR